MAKTIGIKLTDADYRRWAKRARESKFPTVTTWARFHVEKAFDTHIDRPGSRCDAHFNIRCRHEDKSRWEDEAAKLGCSLGELVRNRMNAFVADGDTSKESVDDERYERHISLSEGDPARCAVFGHDWFLQKNTRPHAWRCRNCGEKG